jgi:hypothetical protein
VLCLSETTLFLDDVLGAVMDKENGWTPDNLLVPPTINSKE